MARQYVVTEEEMLSLVETLELCSLRKKAEHATSASIHRQDIDDMHRTFHLYVVRWIQSVGFKGYRG